MSAPVLLSKSDAAVSRRRQSARISKRTILPFNNRCVAKIAAFLILYVLTGSLAFCQDIITRTDSTRLQTNVQQVGIDLIRFRLFASLDSSVYAISTQDVFLIEFADGTRRVFEQKLTPRYQVVAPDYASNFGRNILSASLTDLMYVNVKIAYERLAASGKVGVKVPLSFGLNPDKQGVGFYKRNKVFGAGVSLNYYPFGQGRFVYYLGPQVELSNIKEYGYFYDDRPPYLSHPFDFTYSMLIMALSNGVYYQLTKSLIASLDVGVGVRSWSRRRRSSYDYSYISSVFIPASLQIGYRF